MRVFGSVPDWTPAGSKVDKAEAKSRQAAMFSLFHEMGVTVHSTTPAAFADSKARKSSALSPYGHRRNPLLSISSGYPRGRKRHPIDPAAPAQMRDRPV